MSPDSWCDGIHDCMGEQEACDKKLDRWLWCRSGEKEPNIHGKGAVTRRAGVHTMEWGENGSGLKFLNRKNMLPLVSEEESREAQRLVRGARLSHSCKNQLSPRRREV